MVLLIDNRASGNNTFDNPINVLYVSCVRDTFLYLLISVIVVCIYLSFIYNDNIGFLKVLSMTKIVLLMVLCSGIAQNQCRIIPTPTVLFNDYHDCLVYGYDYSHTLMSSFDKEWVISMEAYTKFSCVADKII